jgi:hypothetical protein
MSAFNASAEHIRESVRGTVKDWRRILPKICLLSDLCFPIVRGVALKVGLPKRSGKRGKQCETEKCAIVAKRSTKCSAHNRTPIRQGD